MPLSSAPLAAPSAPLTAPGPLFTKTPLYQPARLDQLALLAVNEQKISVPPYCDHSIGSLQGQRVTACLRHTEQRRMLLKRYCEDKNYLFSHVKAFSFDYQFFFAKASSSTDEENPLQQDSTDSMLNELRIMMNDYDKNYLVIKYFLDEDGMRQLSKLHELIENPKAFIANPANQAVQYLQEMAHLVDPITSFLYEKGPVTRSVEGNYCDTRYVQLLHVTRVMCTIDAILREGNLKQRNYVLQNIPLHRMDKAINYTIVCLQKDTTYTTYLGRGTEEVDQERKAFFERVIDLLTETQEAINLYQEDQPYIPSFKETLYAPYNP